MEDFNLKDVLNYIFSGYLWLVFFMQLPFVSLEQSILVPKGAAEILLLTIACYFVGNVFRITDRWVTIRVFDILFGDLYQCALYPDKSAILKSNGKLGWLNRGKHTKSLNNRTATKINKKLVHLGLDSKNKKNQFLLTETYVIIRCKSEKVMRLKDLHNFFESLLLPAFLLILLFVVDLAVRILSNSCDITQIGGVILLCFAYYCASYRYRYLKANYIKEVYKTFLLLDGDRKDECRE